MDCHHQWRTFVPQSDSHGDFQPKNIGPERSYMYASSLLIAFLQRTVMHFICTNYFLIDAEKLLSFVKLHVIFTDKFSFDQENFSVSLEIRFRKLHYCTTGSCLRALESTLDLPIWSRCCRTTRVYSTLSRPLDQGPRLQNHGRQATNGS